jgi:tRNA-splicing ligase RtcB
MSRSKAKKTIDGLKVKAELNARNIIIKNPNPKFISDEAPEVYKDIDEVIRVTVDAGICKKIARLMPIGVILG